MRGTLSRSCMAVFAVFSITVLTATTMLWSMQNGSSVVASMYEIFEEEHEEDPIETDSEPDELIGVVTYGFYRDMVVGLIGDQVLSFKTTYMEHWIEPLGD